MSWIPHCVTRFSWDNFAIGITVRLSCYLARKWILCRRSQWISPKSLSDQWPVLLLSELCTSARLGFFFLPVNTDAEQVDVFMKWMWHLSRWLRAEAESLNFWYSHVQLCCGGTLYFTVSMRLSDGQHWELKLGWSSDFWGGKPTYLGCDTATSRGIDTEAIVTEELSVTPASTSFVPPYLNFLRNKWLTHQANKPDRQGWASKWNWRQDFCNQYEETSPFHASISWGRAGCCSNWPLLADVEQLFLLQLPMWDQLGLREGTNWCKTPPA